MTHDAPRTVDVAAGIIWKNGRFLAALRPEGKPRAGFWEFPGGKREPGEAMEETLARELEEELGITGLSIRPWQTLTHDYPDVRVVLHFMHVTEFIGLPVPRDGQTLRWVTPTEAPALNFLPADKGVISCITEPETMPPGSPLLA